jgi:hypothetical protein
MVVSYHSANLTSILELVGVVEETILEVQTTDSIMHKLLSAFFAIKVVSLKLFQQVFA